MKWLRKFCQISLIRSYSQVKDRSVWGQDITFNSTVGALATTLSTASQYKTHGSVVPKVLYFYLQEFSLSTPATGKSPLRHRGSLELVKGPVLLPNRNNKKEHRKQISRNASFWFWVEVSYVPRENKLEPHLVDDLGTKGSKRKVNFGQMESLSHPTPPSHPHPGRHIWALCGSRHKDSETKGRSTPSQWQGDGLLLQVEEFVVSLPKLRLCIYCQHASYCNKSHYLENNTNTFKQLNPS